MKEYRLEELYTLEPPVYISNYYSENDKEALKDFLQKAIQAIKNRLA